MNVDTKPLTIAASDPGYVTGKARLLLRLEGLAAFIAALLAYYALSQTWWLFAILFLGPDLSFAAYGLGPKIGATVYNTAHTYVTPAVVGLAGYALAHPMLIAIAVIWIAHIGADRALGYGLKYPTGFGDTHLGRIGKTKNQ